ncbi:MAG: FGGY-family carbohydrate kinase [Acidimicrobiales bacterium]
MSVDPGSDELTVGIDIGTTSVKALAISSDGGVVARARVPHHIFHQSADHLEHDARAAWRRGPRRALAQVQAELDDKGAGPVAGICVAGMVPSMTAVDRKGVPQTPGLLYGDLRGRGPGIGLPDDTSESEMPDAVGFLRWTATEMPGAHGYWPAQAVATYGLSGHPVMDTMVAVTLVDLHQGGQWNEELLHKMGVQVAQMPDVAFTGHAAGTIKLPAGGGRRVGEAVVAGGSIDAMCDQIVAGAEQVGDVLVIFGATLIVWAVIQDWVEVPGLWTVPHTVPERMLIGGPSNAGALFVDWARSLLRPERRDDAGPARPGDPNRVPVWLPYLRGERVPYHDPSLRAGLYDLDICDTPEGLCRAAYEASGFVVRSFCDRAGITPRRIVASGGGTRSEPWMAAVADASGLPIDCVAVPEGAALGAAYLARMAAGLEADLDGSRRWAAAGRRVEPDPSWQEACDRRYQRFIALGSGH